MRKLLLSDLQKKLQEYGIPEFSKRLKTKTHYDAKARKAYRNPEEYALMYSENPEDSGSTQ